MLRNLFRRRPDPSQPLYEAIVAAARQKCFYRDLDVPDTIDGRFDMLVLHLALVIARLKHEENELRQHLVNRFCNDMDDNLREIGASDIAVGKKVRRMAEAFQGRYAAYDAATDEATLKAALQRNVYAGRDVSGVSTLAHYVLTARSALAKQHPNVIASGKVQFS
nr:ubiquinol-cytochrome C chaperone family protein [Aestuariivirga litoralis]